jgi:hypothetical protein
MFYLRNKTETFTKIYKTNEHPQIATTLGNIADQRSRLGYFQRSYEEFEKVLGKQNYKFEK